MRGAVFLAGTGLNLLNCILRAGNDYNPCA